MCRMKKDMRNNLKAEIDIDVDPNLDIIALISYLQRLGTDIKVKDEQIEDDVVAEQNE